MRASVIIPVWNGASVIADCLDALISLQDDQILEIICVENASKDGSTGLISARAPTVRLLQQPVNLGFAGGVNAGMEAAQGDTFILLNQDCIAQPGWSTALAEALQACPEYGIMGCAIYDAGGQVNHSGAAIRRPDALGFHLTDIGTDPVKRADFVTGAAVAIRRETWEAVGRFDEDFYPAYYEDADYCYRARNKGIETACATAAHVIHLFSSREWQVDPIRHAINGYISRYRFVCKHFDGQDIAGFFDAEKAGLEAVEYLDQAIGRLIAARYTLRNLSGILQRCQLDLGEVATITRLRLLQMGFTQMISQAFAVSRRLAMPEITRPDFLEKISPTPANDASPRIENLDAIAKGLWELDKYEFDVLTDIAYRSPTDTAPESSWQRFKRLLFKRLPSLLSGREEALQAELYRIQHTRRILAYQADVLMEEKYKLLETLINYDRQYS